MERIEVGYHVFLSDGGAAVGAVRAVEKERLLINIENGGDFRVPFDAVRTVHSQKVLLDWGKLDEPLQQALLHTTDEEDFPPHDTTAAQDDDEQDAEAFAAHFDGYRDSPPGEFPGRDIGSRLGAPPSITSPRTRR